MVKVTLAKAVEDLQIPVSEFCNDADMSRQNFYNLCNGKTSVYNVTALTLLNLKLAFSAHDVFYSLDDIFDMLVKSQIEARKGE